MKLKSFSGELEDSMSGHPLLIGISLINHIFPLNRKAAEESARLAEEARIAEEKRLAEEAAAK